MSDSLSIRLTPALRRELRRAAKRQNRPISAIAREAIGRYLALEEMRAIRTNLRPYAESRGLYTDEDIFKAAG